MWLVIAIAAVPHILLSQSCENLRNFVSAGFRPWKLQNGRAKEHEEREREGLNQPGFSREIGLEISAGRVDSK
jgi:hypothetical protein